MEKRCAKLYIDFFDDGARNSSCELRCRGIELLEFLNEAIQNVADSTNRDWNEINKILIGYHDLVRPIMEAKDKNGTLEAV